MKVPLKEPEARAGGTGGGPGFWLRGLGPFGGKAEWAERLASHVTEPPFFGGEGAGVAVTRRRGGRALHGASRIPRSLFGFSASFRLRSGVSAQNFVFRGISSSSGWQLREILYRLFRASVLFFKPGSEI